VPRFAAKSQSISEIWSKAALFRLFCSAAEPKNSGSVRRIMTTKSLRPDIWLFSKFTGSNWLFSEMEAYGFRNVAAYLSIRKHRLRSVFERRGFQFLHISDLGIPL
jgi:hypothetical protein